MSGNKIGTRRSNSYIENRTRIPDYTRFYSHSFNFSRIFNPTYFDCKATVTKAIVVWCSHTLHTHTVGGNKKSNTRPPPFARRLLSSVQTYVYCIYIYFFLNVRMILESRENRDVRTRLRVGAREEKTYALHYCESRLVPTESSLGVVHIYKYALKPDPLNDILFRENRRGSIWLPRGEHTCWCRCCWCRCWCCLWFYIFVSARRHTYSLWEPM